MVKDTALIDLLKDHEESPFRGTDLEQWLKEFIVSSKEMENNPGSCISSIL